MKSFFIAMMTLGMVMTGCATKPAPAPVPYSQLQIDSAMHWRNMGYACVAKGYVSNISAMSAYLNVLDTGLRRRANPQSVEAARQANNSANDWANVPVEACRTLELSTIRIADENAARQRQREAASNAMAAMPPLVVQPYKPMYTSCYSATGMCVSY